MNTYLSAALAAALLLIGCQSAAPIAELLLPTVVCKVIKGKPASESYVRAISVALEKFTASGDLSPASLRAALVSVPISGIQPHEASLLYGAVTLAYSSLGEAWLTNPANKEQVLLALRSLQGGLASGLSQCGSPPPVVSSAVARTVAHHVVTVAEVRQLSEAMAQSLKR